MQKQKKRHIKREGKEISKYPKGMPVWTKKLQDILRHTRQGKLIPRRIKVLRLDKRTERWTSS